MLHVGVLLGHNLALMQLTQASVGAMDVGMMWITASYRCIVEWDKTYVNTWPGEKDSLSYWWGKGEVKGLSKMALCVSPKTQLCGIAAFSETDTNILNVIDSLLIHVMFPTFIHKSCFRNLLTVTPTERDSNVKEWRSEARWRFLCGLGMCAQGIVQALWWCLCRLSPKENLQRRQLSFCQVALLKPASCGWHIA